MLPTALLSAISAEHGGQVVLVLGAGCSKEPPTSLPLSRECAEEAHRRLVADNVLAVGDCANPSDLSLIADVIFAKTGGKAALVERMQPMRFRHAQPNQGYLTTAALLREHAVAAVLTLNFDMALAHAVARLGSDTDVALVLGPEDHARISTINVVYLHRCADADPETWILRTSEIAEGWQGHWEEVVAQRFLSNPVTVFVGLGSPAHVLIETIKNVRNAIPAGARVFQADVCEQAHSPFSAELQLPTGAFIQMGWSQFMEALAARLSEEHRAQLEAACAWLVQYQGVPNESIPALCERVVGLGLLPFGSLRARWFLEEGDYLPWRKTDRRLLADLLLAAGFIERVTGATAFFDDDGIVEFRQGAAILARVAFASGRGVKRWFAIEAELDIAKKKWRRRLPSPTAAILAGISGKRTSPVPPAEITGEVEVGDIMGASEELSLIGADDLRSTPNLAKELLNLP
jgi:hypothetical protein